MKVLQVCWTVKPEVWWTVTVLMIVTMVVNVTSLSGPNVCMVKQKYNITKRVKYRAPMSVRTYEWCFAMPPRCSKWNTEMRDVTKLETEERTAEMAVCCPGYKLKDVSCVPTCPSGKTGQGCSEDCPPNKWGPSCVHDCKKCDHGSCDSVTGECRCQHGWQGESCETSMITTEVAAMMEQLLTTETASTKTSSQSTVTTRSSTTTTTATTRSTSSPSTKLIHTQASTSTTKETTQMTIPIKSITIATLSKSEIEDPTTFTTPKNSVSLNISTQSIIPINTTTTSETVKNTANDLKKTTVNLTSSYNRTEVPRETVKVMHTEKAILSTESTTENIEIETTIVPTTNNSDTEAKLATQSTKMTTAITVTSTSKPETNKPTTTVKLPTTTKTKPKEIWIKPAQKGDSPFVEAKFKPSQELPPTKLKHKEVSEITTPKTIIVSIIPTSVTYVTFRKISLTTASSMAQKNNITTVSLNPKAPEQESTKPTSIATTSSPFTVKVSSRTSNISSTNRPLLNQNVTKSSTYLSSTRRTSIKQTSNSMSSTLNVANKRLNSSLLTTVASFVTHSNRPSRNQHSLNDTSTKNNTTTLLKSHMSSVTEKISLEQNTAQNHFFRVTQRNDTIPITEQPKVTEMMDTNQAEIYNKGNLSLFNTITKHVTDHPLKDEETFHILTEPEHITAVMGDKGHETSTINLISVISIAGGVMMAVITVAVVIVMLERCRKPRYEDVRKYNDIRMQVMIDNKNDDPPPYVRSIFHTPLPDPPTSEKCHYQPISTLDRNLKQFMRPVVVQTISPLMLENFRGILECHYDHLPRRSQDIQPRGSITPSIDERTELLPPQRIHSLTDSDIEAMKCEAKLDMIDNTTSEPLYAEIPCWRPPSAHAIEVVNLNGEAVTEL